MCTGVCTCICIYCLIFDHVAGDLQYIKRMISKGSTPVLTLVEKRTVDVDYPREEYYMPSLPKREKPKAKGTYVFSLSAFD